MALGIVLGVEFWEGASVCFSLFTAPPTRVMCYLWKHGLNAVSRNKTSGVTL